MKRLFKAQKSVAILYIIVTLVVFVYTLAFMTQYSDLSGLKMSQNQKIANFYSVGLQTFNRAVFAGALIAIVGVALVFILQIRSRVPDRFAVIVMAVCLAMCGYGAWFAIVNLASLADYYGALDFSTLALEGGAADYRPVFTTFQIGIGVYAAQLVVCAVFAAILIASHVRYKKLEKEGRSA